MLRPAGRAVVAQAGLAVRRAGCGAGAFTEQQEELARPRALLTTRACWWAIGQLRREHASVAGLARQLGTTWRTLWLAIRPLLAQMADDELRFDGVTALGVDDMSCATRRCCSGWR